MTDSETIKALMALLERHGIGEFEYEDGERHVHVVAGVPASQEIATAAPKPANATTETIDAPYPGVFRPLRPTGSQARPLPRLVRRGEIIAQLQIGPLLRPVVAPNDGVIAKLLMGEGTVAGYGSPLFAFHRSDAHSG